MVLPDVSLLQKQFGAAGRIGFRAGAGGLPVAVLAGTHGACEVSLYGGQVLRYKPLGHAPVLFVSRQARFEPGQAIRGGIPVCWPWFGAHPSQAQMPAHGFARLLGWSVLAVEYSAQETELKLGLHDSAATRVWWPHAFALALRVVLGKSLRVELTTCNSDRQPVTITEALHSYLLVRDVSQVALLGLEEARHFDALTGREQAAQAQPVTIHGEVDRIYTDRARECRVDDAGLGRQIVLSKRNSHSTVVWNPWEAKARRLADLGEGEYRQMLCVETANAREAALTLPPGEEHTLALNLQVELKTL
jgi:D-hexose-6-phosphate mutarotase